MLDSCSGTSTKLTLTRLSVWMFELIFSVFSALRKFRWNRNLQETTRQRQNEPVFKKHKEK